MNNWLNLCKALSSQTYQSEADLESHFQQFLVDIFGWNPQEIDRQKIVYFGHQPKRIDLALIHNNRYTLVIELKAPNVRLYSGDSTEQVSSYMLQTQAEFGILANDKNLQLFYHPLDMREQPKCILDLDIDETDEDGAKLGDLLGRDSYDEAKFKDYCEQKLYLRRIEDLKDLLTSGRGKDVLLSALPTLGGTNEGWQSALSKIRISRTDGENRLQDSNERVGGELGLLLSDKGLQTIYEALVKTHADGEVFTDEMRRQALAGLIISKWENPITSPTTRRNAASRQKLSSKKYDVETLKTATQKIRGLIQLYLDKLENDSDFRNETNKFINACETGVGWANKHILNPEKLESIPPDEFLNWLQYEAMPNMPRWLDGTVYRHAYKPFQNENECEANRLKLIDDIRFLHNTPEEKRFEAVYELLDEGSGRYIRGWGREAWLTLAAYQFPNQVPRINGETEQFFDIIGLRLRGTIDQQLQFVYLCYSNWGTMTGDKEHLTLFQCDNLIAFATRNAAGRQYMNENFGADFEVKTLHDRPVA